MKSNILKISSSELLSRGGSDQRRARPGQAGGAPMVGPLGSSPITCRLSWMRWALKLDCFTCFRKIHETGLHFTHLQSGLSMK